MGVSANRDSADCSQPVGSMMKWQILIGTLASRQPGESSVEDDRFDRIAKAVGRRTTRRLAFGLGALVLGSSGSRGNVPPVEGAEASDCQGVDHHEIISKNNCGITHC